MFCFRKQTKARSVIFGSTAGHPSICETHHRSASSFHVEKLCVHGPNMDSAEDNSRSPGPDILPIFTSQGFISCPYQLCEDSHSAVSAAASRCLRHIAGGLERLLNLTHSSNK